MKKLLISSVTGVAMAGLMVAPVFACTPKGVITKFVTDVTTGSQMVDANAVADALVVHPGDTLLYTVVIANNGGTTNDDADAMIETVLTDNLPAGVTPVSGSAAINETVGRISEHSKVTKTYNVTVSKDAKDGDVITNQACFTGEATNHDKNQHQKGCDVAIVKVSVPTPPVTPQPPVTPPKELPHTGIGNLLPLTGLSASLGYAANLLRLKRRNG